MSALLCSRSLRRLQLVLGLALLAFVFAPGASAAPPLDTVSVTGSGSFFFNISVNAQSGTSGQNPSGSFSAHVFLLGSAIVTSGPVTCLKVSGPDRGGGTATAPTTAVLTFFDQTFLRETVTFLIVDRGGGGTDTFTAGAFGRAPTDCSAVTQNVNPDTLTNGRGAVFDAPVLPTSKEQCKDGGWLNFPQFKNQGDCVSFVATHGKNQPG
jgi:hypothetical protein